jgi:hypothetical protein
MASGSQAELLFYFLFACLSVACKRCKLHPVSAVFGIIKLMQGFGLPLKKKVLMAWHLASPIRRALIRKLFE